MANLPKLIAQCTTHALRKRMLAHLDDIPKEIKDLLIDARIKDDPQALQRLESIIAGSIRGATRLHQARITTSSERKLCGNEREDQEHRFWKCPCYSFIRGVYRNGCMKGSGCATMRDGIIRNPQRDLFEQSIPKLRNNCESENSPRSAKRKVTEKIGMCP